MKNTYDWEQIVEAVSHVLLAVQEDNASYEMATATIESLGANLPSDVAGFLIDSIWERDADREEFAKIVDAFSKSRNIFEFRAFMDAPI